MRELLDDQWGGEEKGKPIRVSMPHRLLATAIDVLLLFLLILLLFANGIALEFWYLVVGGWLGLLVLLETSPEKASLGKRIMRLKVTSSSENPVTVWRIMVRTVIKFVLMCMPFIFIITMIIAQKKRKDPQQLFFHDVISKTKVISILQKEAY